MSYCNNFYSNDYKRFENRKKSLQVPRSTKYSFSSSTSSVGSKYPKKFHQPFEINIAVPEVKQSTSKPNVSRRLQADSFNAFSSKLSKKSTKLNEKQELVKEWLNRITSSKERLKLNNSVKSSTYNQKIKNPENETNFDAFDSISSTSTNFYSSAIQKNKSTNSSESTKTLKKFRNIQHSNQPSLDESTTESSSKNLSEDALKIEKTLESNKQKEKEKKKTSLPNIKSEYKPFFPIRSDQKKLSSKLFLGSLLPPEEKELADLRKWKLKKSKQF